ncbi:hypothetical protein N2152v2_004681 [Parachlorella kessleri]
MADPFLYSKLDVEVFCGHGETGKRGCASWKRWKDSIRLSSGAPIHTWLTTGQAKEEREEEEEEEEEEQEVEEEPEHQGGSGAVAGKPKEGAAAGTRKAKREAAATPSKPSEGAAAGANKPIIEATGGPSKQRKSAAGGSKLQEQQQHQQASKGKNVDGKAPRKAAPLPKEPEAHPKRARLQAGVRAGALDNLGREQGRRSSRPRPGNRTEALLAAVARVEPVSTGGTPSASEDAAAPVAEKAKPAPRSRRMPEHRRVQQQQPSGEPGPSAPSPVEGQDGPSPAAGGPSAEVVGRTSGEAGAAAAPGRSQRAAAGRAEEAPAGDAAVASAGEAADPATEDAAAAAAESVHLQAAAGGGSTAGLDPVSVAVMLLEAELRRRARRQEELERRVTKLEAAVGELQEAAHKRRRVDS